MAEIPLFANSIGDEEVEAISGSLRSKWLINGPQVEAFEREFAEFIGVDHAVAVNSCTAGLHLALAALPRDGRDEVILPAFNFSAALASVLQAGYKPVFCDVRSDGNLDVEDVRRRLGPKTRAIQALHYTGVPADLTALLVLAQETGIDIVQDAAHAFGSIHEGKRIGAHGGSAVFSFGPAKHLVISMGGMVTTNDGDAATMMKKMRSYGMGRSVYDRRFEKTPWHYDVTVIGHNFRMPDPLAAVGRVQLKKASEIIGGRRRAASMYDDALAPLENFVKPLHKGRFVEDGAAVLYYVAQVSSAEDRDGLVRHLQEKGINATVHWASLLPNFSVLGEGESETAYPQSAKLAQSVLTLPLYQSMTAAEVETVVQGIASYLDGV